MAYFIMKFRLLFFDANNIIFLGTFLTLFIDLSDQIQIGVCLYNEGSYIDIDREGSTISDTYIKRILQDPTSILNRE